MTTEVLLLNVPEVCRRIGLSRPSIYRLLETDPTFPKPTYPARRAPRWRSDEIAAWIERLSDKRPAAA